MFIHSIIYELLKANKIDWKYLQRYTNANWLVINNPGKSDHGLFIRDKNNNPLIFCKKNKQANISIKVSQPSFFGNYEYNKKI